MSGTLRLRGATSGYSELQAPAVAADQTFILPTAGGTLLTTDSPVPKLTLELGSASQPSLTFEGDTDTGLYSSGTNTLNLVTGGNSRLSISPTGGVLIGGVITGQDNISGLNYVASGAGSAANPEYRFAALGVGLFSASGTGNVAISTNAIERLTVDSSGNVGIGTSAPATILSAGTGTGTNAITINGAGSSTSKSQLILHGGGTNNPSAAIEYDAADAGLAFQVGNYSSLGSNERMRIDSSGNVGIGTTSPTHQLTVHNASTTGGTIEANRFSVRDNYGNLSGLGNGFISPAANTLAFATNSTERMRIYGDGGVSFKKYLEFRDGGDTTFAGYLGSGNHIITGSLNTDLGLRAETNLLFASGGNAERMRINSAGLVGIGTSNPIDENAFSQAVNLNGPSGCSYVAKVNNSSTNCGQFGYYGTTCYMINKAAGPCVFYTTNAEKAQVSATGYFHASSGGSTTYYGNVSPGFHSFDQVGVAQWIAGFRSSHTTPYGLTISYNGASPNNTSSQFIYAADTSRLRFGVKSNGGIENFSGNNSNLCDEREKKNIVSLETKWDKVKNWELRKFHYNEDADTDDLRYGVIAQEVEIENPELITDFTKQRAEDAVLDEDGTVVTQAKEEILRKGVKEQQMMWMSIKALQEAMAKIETLEAKVAALENV